MTWAVVCGIHEFLKHYLLKLGILDGWPGFVISFGAGEGAFYKHAKAYVARRDASPPPSRPVHRTND